MNKLIIQKRKIEQVQAHLLNDWLKAISTKDIHKAKRIKRDLTSLNFIYKGLK